VGASPYQAPATLNVIAHVELNGGVWYPQGGIYTIANSLTQLAQDLGVEIRTESPVKQITIANGEANGVILTNGTKLTAEAVVANVDVATAYEQLLPQEIVNLRRLNRLKQVEPSCSGFMLLLGVKGTYPNLAHHNIFFSSDYPREFDQIFRQGIPPTEPTIYVAITAKTDPAHAPAGCENWFVLVNAPPLGDQFDWNAQTAPYRELVLNHLATYGLDIRPHIRTEKIFTPEDIARQSGARRGALYGASSNNPFTAFQRPHNRAPDVKGLYFAGGTAHPGGGVPMVMLSGQVAARLVLEDLL